MICINRFVNHDHIWYNPQVRYENHTREVYCIIIRRKFVHDNRSKLYDCS